MTTVVTLPDGTRKRVVLAISQREKRLGLTAIPRLTKAFGGMLFAWESLGLRDMTTTGCLIPLDIIWLDDGRRVVDIDRDTPTGLVCVGGVGAMYVLELGAGECAAHSVEVGSVLKF